MQNVVVTNKQSKRKLIEAFIRSRGILNFIILDNSDDLYDSLLVETSNLHIFDYLMDMSIVNAIRELRDRANSIRVYVTSIEAARPYLSITDDVQILPDEYSIMSYFWDNPACNVKNVMGFQASGLDFCKVIPPGKFGQTKKMVVNLSTRKVPLSYTTLDGRHVKEMGSQIVVSGKTKIFDIASLLKTRDQAEVYNRKQRDLGDLPDLAAPEEVVEEPVVEEVVEAPKPKKPKKEKPVPEVKPEKTVDGTYVSFQEFTGGSEQVSTAVRKVRRRRIVETYATIADYCLAKEFMSREDCDALLLELKDKPQKDTLFGDIALERGLLADEQLIEAITNVTGIGVMTWDELKDVKPDYSLLLHERCKQYKIFKVINSTLPGSDPDADILIATTSLMNGAYEMGRMFDSPIIKYTLDKYITKKLEE